MDWKQVIKRNRKALAVIIAGLVAMISQTDTIPRPLRRSVLRILRPAESALRRLIVIVAAMRKRKVKRANGRETGACLPDFSSFGQNKALPAFRLVDPRKRFREFKPRVATNLGIPRISVPGFTEPVPAKSAGHDTANATTILRRIAALDHALKTLPRQARRLNRLMARRTMAKPGPGRVGPIRPGRPPGFRKRSTEPVDDILRDCHFLALDCGFKPP